MDHEFSTTDLPLAAFLVLAGRRLERIERIDGWGTFYFQAGPELESLHFDWLNRVGHVVVPRDYVALIRDLKSTVAAMRDGSVRGWAR